MVPEGYQYGAGFALAAAVVAWLAAWWFAIPLIAVGLFMMFFFRDPERVITDEPGAAVSPADGKVVDVRDTGEAGSSKQRISIFLSPMNVHVNRSPVAGTITKIDYAPGRFHAAWKEEASIENERNTITVATGTCDVTFKQIAGVLARRVVCWKREGDAIARGERIGLMKFSSRMDVFFDASWQIAVRPGEIVEGGVSVIARRSPTA